MQLQIIDFGLSNVRSVKRRLESLGARPEVTADPSRVRKADKLVLPGVGHFGRAMSNLRSSGFLDALQETVLVRRVPVLGICLGMQLMAATSEEGGSQGLGWLDAHVVKFQVSDRIRFKIPHAGWNSAAISKRSALLDRLPSSSEFYFLHSYHIVCHVVDDVACETEYGYRFASAVERENIFGVQFHPEKSYGAGDTVLKNFLRL